MKTQYEIYENNNIRKKTYRQDKAFSVLIVLLLLFGVYLVPNIPSISIGESILILTYIIIVLKKRKVLIYFDYTLFLFIAYSLVISFLVVFIEHGSVINTISRITRDTFYYITIYIFSFSFLDYSTFLYWVKRICIVLAILIILQELVYILTGYLIPGLLFSGVVAKTQTVDQLYQHMLVSANRTGYLKANGFLTEGAHCAQALAISSLAIYDFEKHDRKSIWLTMFFSVASAMTFSASALVFTGLIWIMIIISMIRQKRINTVIGLSLMAVFIIMLGLGFVGGSIQISSVFNRLLSALSSSTADRSAFLRIYKGFVYWKGLPLINKFAGIGFGNYESLVNLYTGEITSMLLDEYMNSLSYILVSSGIIGFILFIVFYIKLFKKCNYKGKMFIILLLFMSISSSPYSSIYWIWMMLFILFNTRLGQGEEIK